MEGFVLPQALLDALKTMSDSIAKAVEPIHKMAKALAESLRVLGYITGTKPKYATLSVDEYGWFVINGKQMMRCHSRTSLNGKLLYLLYEARGTIVNYEQMNLSKDRRHMVFRDLKTQWV